MRTIAELRADLTEAGTRRWGPRWIAPLAKTAGWNERTLRTLLRRGKQLPSADRLLALEEAAGLQNPLQVHEPKAPWEMEGVRDRRAFTALVEALRLVEAKGSDAEWRAAWATIRGAFLVLQELSGFEDRHWRRIFGEDEAGKPLDHWKVLTKKSEEDAIRRALHSTRTGGTDR